MASAGKRAAFGLFYAPLHYLLVRHIVEQLPPPRESSSVLVDLGCGTGAAGAACAESRSVKTVVGVDKHPWALGEAAHTYRAFDLPWRTRRGDIGALPLPRERASFISAYTLNEIPDFARDTLLTRLFACRPRICELLVVEPIARTVAPWWSRWRREFLDAGGRADEWRMRVELPPILAKLDRAAGLDHRELTGRTLWVRQ